MRGSRAFWFFALLAGAFFLLAASACAPAAPVRQDVAPAPTPVLAVPTPVSVPLDHSLVDPLLGQGYVWIKGNLLRMPEGVRLEGMLRLACAGETRWCPTDLWTLSKGNSRIQVSVTDGIVVSEEIDPSDPLAFAFLNPFVTPAGSLLDAWSPIERGRFAAPTFPSGPLPPLPTPDFSTRRSIYDIRQVVLKGQRIPLPEGVFVFYGTGVGEDLQKGVVLVFKGPVMKDEEGRVVYVDATFGVYVGVRDPDDPVLLEEKADPAYPAAFDFLKPYVRWEATPQDYGVHLWPQPTPTVTPP